MTPDEILRCKTKVLTQEQREDYFTHGYISVESIIDNNTLEDIVNVTNQFIEASKEIFSSGDDYDLSPGHNAERPMLRRLKRPDEKHELYWNFANGILADIATDLAGPDVVFHHSKLNFKWAGGSDAVKWHQDAQFFPHTNYNVFTIGCYLEDTNMDNGPLAVIPDSHLGPLYDQYGENGDKGIELYNVKKDPKQYTSLAKDPTHQKTVARFKAQMKGKLRNIRNNDLKGN